MKIRRKYFMTNEFQVVFHNLNPTDAITEAVNKRVDKLQRFCDQIITGRIVLDSPHNNHHKGKVYSVSLEIHTPLIEVRVNQDQHDNHAHEDLYVAIRDAFNAAERQLRSVNKKHRKMSAHKVIILQETNEFLEDDLTEVSEDNVDDQAA
ncbi:MAG TPA: ribosome-associated translation inhibitor RaiA [Gammaproteobacteria bacterium]|jgi:ribosomal subunit interface protein|nr:ribosome-associated translation inhibitor RaiA [Gammaproteobacteria bacterium]